MLAEGLRAALLVPLALLPPGWALGRHLGRGLRPTERLLVGWALAPFGLVVPALALALAIGLPLRSGFWISELIWAVAALWITAARPPAGAEPIPPRGRGFPGIAVLALAAALALLVMLPALAIPYVRMWSDAWFHSAAAIEVARNGVPPGDPYFAGIPLYYFWFHHVLIALLGIAAQASPFHLQSMINVWAAVLMVLAAAQLAYRLAGRAAAAWASVIAVFGLNPLGWGWCVLRALTGDDRGVGALLDGLRGMNGAGLSITMGFPWIHSSMLNRLWTGTAQTPAMALSLALAWSLARHLYRPSGAGAVRSLLIATAMLATHPAYGAFAIAACGAGLVAAGLSDLRRGAAWGAILALAAAFLAAIPYVRSASVPGAITPVRLGFFTPNALSLTLAIGPWWVVAMPGIRKAWREGPLGRFAWVAFVAAAALSLAVILPAGNSEKGFYLAWLLFTPFAAAGVVRWSEWLRGSAVVRRALVLMLVVPSSLLFVIGVLMERRSPGVLVRGESADTIGMPLVTGWEGEAYRFIQDYLPPDGVILEGPRPTVNEPIPVLAQRRVFAGPLDVYLGNHFGAGEGAGPQAIALRDELDIRRSIQHELFTSAPLTEPQRLYLKHFDSPLYLLLRRSELPDEVWNAYRDHQDWASEFANQEVRIYRFRSEPP
jgi:hypothetical protein